MKNEKIVKYREIEEEVQLLVDKGLPFVLYKMPEEGEISLIYSKGGEGERCFLLHPFEKGDEVRVWGEVKMSTKMEAKTEEVKTIERTIGERGEGQEHIGLVEKGVRQIKEGIFKKVVLSRRVKVKIENKGAWEYFERLINYYKTAFCYVYWEPRMMWMAATPERLVSYKDGVVRTMSLAGTQKYEAGKEIVWGEKEIEEQNIVTREIVGQLKNFSKEVKVSEKRNLVAGSVVHICNEISCEADSESVEEIIKQLHPTPAVCGCERDKAKKFIIENEGFDREYYSGYCGIFDKKHNERSLFVNLRCMKIVDNTAFIYVGGGITEDSVGADEYQETENKSETMRRVLG